MNIQLQAARNGRSMEAEVRALLSQTYDELPLGAALLDGASKFRETTGGIDLDLSMRSTPRVPDLSAGGK